MVATEASLIVHGAIVALGGAFIYMGTKTSSDLYKELSAGTMLPAASAFLIGLGIAAIVVGVFGIYATLRGARQLVARHTTVLGLLVLLFFANAVVGFVMYHQASTWPFEDTISDSKARYIDSVGQAVCPALLGYYCHTAPLKEPTHNISAVQALLMPSLPAGVWSPPDKYSRGVGVNATVLAAVSVWPNNTGRFVDLCTNVSSRVELLGPAKFVAQDLQTGCDVCRKVAPVQALPHWIQVMGFFPSHPRAEHGIYYDVNRNMLAECINRHHPAQTSPASYFNRVVKQGNDYLMSALFLDEWATHSWTVGAASTSAVIVVGVLAATNYFGAKHVPLTDALLR